MQAAWTVAGAAWVTGLTCIMLPCPLAAYQGAVQFLGAMMTLIEFSLAVLALLATPGPTNTLLLIGGGERGFLRALRLIPAEMAGYFMTVLPLALAGEQVLASLPGLRAAVAIMAGLWVALLALRLWRIPVGGETAVTVTARTVLTTTILNPKGLIFGLVLIPSPSHLVLHLAVFAALVMAVAAAWAALGACLSARGTGGQGDPSPCPVLPTLRRVAALWLAFVSVTLILKGLTA